MSQYRRCVLGLFVALAFANSANAEPPAQSSEWNFPFEGFPPQEPADDVVRAPIACTEGADCTVSGDGRDDTCCSGSCLPVACTLSIPGSCFGTCVDTGADLYGCQDSYFGACEPGEPPIFTELTPCASSADCSPLEYCTTETEPCGPQDDPALGTILCLGFCLPTATP